MLNSLLSDFNGFRLKAFQNDDAKTIMRLLISGPPSKPGRSRPPAQKDVDRTLACDVSRTFVAQSMRTDVLPEMLPATQQDRLDGEM
jgi:hypothetical protein